MATNSPKKPISLERMEYPCTQIPLYKHVRQKVTTGIDDFSETIKNRSTVRQRLKKGGDVKISFILLLSERLGVNFLDMYMQYLPPELRTTAQTRELMKIIKQMEDNELKKDSTIIQQQEVIDSLRSMLDKALSR